MQDFIKKLDAWQGWSKYLTDQDTNQTKLCFTFVDMIVAQNIHHKKPLGYNTEGHKFCNELLDYFTEVKNNNTIRFTAKYEHTYYENPDKADVEGDWGGIEHMELEITLHDLTKYKVPMAKQFLDLGYKTLLVVTLNDIGSHQFVIG